VRVHIAYNRGNQDALISFGLMKLAWTPDLLELINSHAGARLAVRGQLSPDRVPGTLQGMRNRILESGVPAPLAGATPVHVPLRMGSNPLGVGAGQISHGPKASISTFLGPNMAPTEKSRATKSLAIASTGELPFLKLTDEAQLRQSITHLALHGGLDIADVDTHPIIQGNPDLKAHALKEVAASMERKRLRAEQALRSPEPQKSFESQGGFDPRPKVKPVTKGPVTPGPVKPKPPKK